MLVSVVVIVALILFSSMSIFPRVFAKTNVESLGSVAFLPANNLVSFNTFYDFKFNILTTASISNVSIIFASGYSITAIRFVNSLGIPNTGHGSVSGQTYTYNFASSPIQVPAGTLIAIETAGVVNPATAGSYTGTIETLAGSTVVASGTTPSYSIIQIVSGQLASSISIAALTAGTLSVTGASSFAGAATFASTVTTTGLLTAKGGISTTNIAASGTLSVTGAASFQGAVSTTGLLTASGGITTPDATIGSMSLSGSTISTSSDTLAVDSAAGQLWVGDGVSYPLVLWNDTGNVMAYFYSSGSYEEFINVGDLWTGGNLYAAGGLFAVNTSGQITTESCGFYCLDGSSLPNWWAESQSSTTTTASYAPGRNAVALVFITVDIQSPVNGANADIGVTLQNSYPDNSGITIEPESVHAFYIPTGAEMSVTYEFYVYGFTAQTGAGTFSSVLSTCNVGPACGGSWNTAWGIYDNFINVIWLPE